MKTRIVLSVALTLAIVSVFAVVAVLPVSHSSAGVVTPAFALDTADQNQVQKAVPILSLGSGLRVGMALVTGPTSQVDKVKVVAQLEGDFKGARIRGLVPIDTESLKDLHKVPQTSVSAYADLKL